MQGGHFVSQKGKNESMREGGLQRSHSEGVFLKQLLNHPHLCAVMQFSFLSMFSWCKYWIVFSIYSAVEYLLHGMLVSQPLHAASFLT